MKAMKLPNGWSRKPLASLVHPDRKISYGIVQPGDFEPNGVLLVRGQDYSDGWAKPDSMFRVSEAIDAPYRRSRLKAGDIIMTIVGAGTGNIAIVPDYLDGANITQTTARIAVNKTVADRDFIRLVLESHIGRHEVYRNIKGGAQPGLNIGDVEEFQIPTPPLPEQCAIATTLMPWISALEKLDALIAAKDRRKQALMQQLLTGRRRLSGFNKQWVKSKLGSLFTNRTETNRIDLPLLSITADQGVVARETLTKRDTSSEDKSKYLRIVPGDIGYNTMRMWQGVSALSALDGIVSPAYTILAPTARIDGEFAAQFFKLPHTISLFHRYSQGLVDDTLNLKFPSFAVIEVIVPGDVTEQRAIADILCAADTELRLLRRQRATLDEQKRGLMQHLLTGKRRVST